MMLVLALMLAGAPSRPPATPQAATPPLVGPDCQKLLANPAPGVAQLCQAESGMRGTDSATLDAVERRRRLEASAAIFDAASAGLQDAALKLYALEALARLYDAQHLAEPAGMEQALRAMVPLMPGNSTPLRRVAQLQEELGLVDAAENTLLDAKQQAPNDVEIYRTLSHFYARRAVQIAAEGQIGPGAASAPAPGDPDADGYYSPGGNVSPPAPISTPGPERVRGAAAGVAAGSVVLEIRVDEWGAVSGARIVQSVPMLDDAVLAAVRRWRYTPSTIQDRAVPVKMTVVVNVPAVPR